MKTVAICAAILLLLDALKAVSHMAAFSVAGIILAFCLGRLWEAGSSPLPAVSEAEG